MYGVNGLNSLMYSAQQARRQPLAEPPVLLEERPSRALPDARQPQCPGVPADTPLAALVHARLCLEVALEDDESWRAMKQLEAREAAGDWLDVIESDALRDSIAQALAADPRFMAWQFADAAIACLESGAAAANTAAHAGDLAAPVETPPPVEVMVMAETSAVAAAPAQDIEPRSSPTRQLSTRIPTLQPHESRDIALIAEAVAPVDPARTATTVATMAMNPHPAASLAASADPAVPPDESDPELATLFDTRANGIEEAEVRIVKRTRAAPPLLDARLPPLPLTQPGSRLPRASRATAVKWADADGDMPSDFHPVGSAMDEAQVTIIPVGQQSEAATRAERRNLGVAPDREAQMRRFLKALSGD